MINKRVIYLMLLATSIVGCNTKSSASSQKEVTEYDKINAALSIKYNSFSIHVTTTKDDLKLNSDFTVQLIGSNYLVNYTIEQFNELSIDDDDGADEMISTKTGSYTASESEFSLSTFYVSESYFDSCHFETDLFIGEIKNGKKYLKADYNCNDMTVNIAYDSYIKNISITYSLDSLENCSIRYYDFSHQ